MKVYEMTFMDIERGKIRRWKRNKEHVKWLTQRWADRWPLRKLLLVERIDIPTNKPGLLKWLNENCGGA